MAVITSAGPLTRIEVTPDLNNAINHVGDATGEWFADTASGTFLAVNGTLYGPAYVPASAAVPRTPFTPINQSGPTGTGTAADPYMILTIVRTGPGVTLAQIDRYVVGNEYYDTSLTIRNNSGTRQTGFVYTAGDSHLADSDAGYGRVSGTAPAASTTPDSGGRIEALLPRTPGNTYMEGDYYEVWQVIGQQLPFPNTCRCNEYVDNGIGIAWPVDLAAGASVTYDWSTAFAPTVRSTTTLSSDVNPSVCGQPVTFTAQVSPVAPATGTPTGQVVFIISADGPSLTATLDGTGRAQVVVNDLGVGSHDVIASYQGDVRFIGSSSNLLTQIVNKAPSLTTVTLDPTPSVCGQPVQVCATVTAVSPSSGTPGGTVHFTGPGGLDEQATLVGGKACVTTSSLESGPVTVDYSGDGCFLQSSGVAQATVGQATPSVAVTVNPTPSVCGQPVRVCATVTAVSPGSGTPTGSVTFTGPDGFDQSVDLVNGQACLDTAFHSSGQVTAAYGGDACFVPGSGSARVTVNPASSAMTLTVNPGQTVCGQPVRLCATVTAVSPGSGTPTGSVTFTGPDGLNQPVQLVNGQACLDVTFDTSGPITANYPGDNCFTGVTGRASVTIVPVNTVLTAPAEQIRVRVNGTFVIPAMSATLKTTSGAPVANQTVTFRANALTGPIALGSAVTDASGVATLAPPQVTVPPTAVTARTYTASFAGSTCYNPSSVSASLTTVLFPPIP